jgi:hypothetical protein
LPAVGASVARADGLDVDGGIDVQPAAITTAVIASKVRFIDPSRCRARA